ncbi:MAG TPA: septum formation initiator family protein [Streptosporangiaceae bacterium]
MTEPVSRGDPGGRPPGLNGGSPRTGGSRPHVTGRAAILAVVFCAIALSLAYPVREYIAQRRQIDQLQAQRDQLALHMKGLRQQQKRLHDPAYIERQARDRLHMCFPHQKCYVIIEPAPKNKQGTASRADGVPWYARLWKSVQQASQQVPSRPKGGQEPAGKGKAGCRTRTATCARAPGGRSG